MKCAYVVSDGTGSLPSPLILHALITTECNATCQGCPYRGNPVAEKSIGWWQSRIAEFAALGGQTIAIGGGEPTLREGIEDLVSLAKQYKLFVSMTTNGVVPRCIPGLDLVHISRDSRHPITAAGLEQALEFYRQFVPQVGLNIVLWDETDLEFAESTPLPATLIMPKPWWEVELSRDRILEVLSRPGKAADACLSCWLNRDRRVFRTPCLQGRVSMCLDAQGRASMCSHVAAHSRKEVEGVSAAWGQVRLSGGIWEEKTLEDCLEAWR